MRTYAGKSILPPAAFCSRALSPFDSHTLHKLPITAQDTF
jgi:hypothetical protein